jgi:hypothetical protein
MRNFEGGSMEKQKNDRGRPSSQEDARFLQYMRAIEGEGPQTSLLALIIGDGVQVPSPDELSDEQLSVLFREPDYSEWSR